MTVMTCRIAWRFRCTYGQRASLVSILPSLNIYASEVLAMWQLPNRYPAFVATHPVTEPFSCIVDNLNARRFPQSEVHVLPKLVHTSDISTELSIYITFECVSRYLYLYDWPACCKIAVYFISTLRPKGASMLTSMKGGASAGACPHLLNS